MLQIAKHQQQAAHINPDDSRSETSGETSSGDSGRGASEEEITSASPSHGKYSLNSLFNLKKNSNSYLHLNYFPAVLDKFSRIFPS